MATIETINASVYDYPRYYDLVFGSDWKAEFEFLLDCFEKHIPDGAGRLFEPACGTGRLLFRLKKAGYQVSGCDLNQKAVDYCNGRLAKHKLAESAFVADMADFRLATKCDAAFNMINSFRHLTMEADARAHLKCIANALRTGGLYVLGIHLTPTAGKATEEESWSARRGNLSVVSRIWLLERHLEDRMERYGMTFDVYTPTRTFRLVDELVLRTYTAEQFFELVDSVGNVTIAEVYDFRYRIDLPIEVGPRTEDAVFVLRKTTS